MKAPKDWKVKQRKRKRKLESEFDREDQGSARKGQEVQMILRKLRKARKGKRDVDKEDFEEALKRSSPEDELLIEVLHTSKIFGFNLYLKRGETVRYVGGGEKVSSALKRLKRDIAVRSINDSSLWNSFFKFIQKEGVGETVEIHPHDFGSYHAVWKISGEELKAVKRLMGDRSLRRLYGKGGIESLKSLAERLKEVNGRNYPTFLEVDSSDSEIVHSGRIKSSDIEEIRENILMYSDVNELTPKEAVAALKMEDEEFARKYESVMDRMDEMLESIEAVFGSALLEDGR